MLTFCATNIYTLTGFGTACSYTSIVCRLVKECNIQKPKLPPKKTVGIEKAKNNIRSMNLGTVSQSAIITQFEIAVGTKTFEKINKKESAQHNNFIITGIADAIIDLNDNVFVIEVKNRTTELREFDIRERIQMLAYCYIYGIDSIIYLQHCNGQMSATTVNNFYQKYSSTWQHVLQRLQIVADFIIKAQTDPEYLSSIYSDGKFNKHEIAKTIYWI